MSFNRVSKVGAYRRAGALFLVTLATVMYGCGSSDREAMSGTKGASKRVNQEDLYPKVGTGKSKAKAAVSRKERMKLLHEAARKPESE